MHETIEGVFHDGKIELSEQPRSRDPARVLVTFIRDEAADAPEEKRLEAIQELLDQMKRGIHLGGGPYPKREEIYDREHGRVNSD
jgi:hypothetical protein